MADMEEIINLKAQAGEFQRRLGAAEGQIEFWMGKAKKLDAVIRCLTDYATDFESRQMEILKKENGEYKQRLAQRDAEIETLQREILKTQGELSREKEVRNLAVRQAEALESEIAALKNELHAVRKRGIPQKEPDPAGSRPVSPGTGTAGTGYYRYFGSRNR